ncbi:Stk1 family PASTA domain-containing Ser/Thr kinase [Streptomyces spiramenti]|uniref:non-specific serine/threonine protein kinase n=1 Tax=Streptomyces spiramenti TaxID=2720606 RepID=A0ABX1AUR5_9ACTN|nr:Stk1 family PASTA domain-containing Ser/Thr kinase [Streptomyces spiramenti]NJP68030.1 Stk1 family PASTA domain-containing Ser/Thr kinase [Streptomyces spiramenti]
MEEPRRLGGRYELGHVLGRGGMAEVYLAHDTRLGRTVAVKTLRADLARDPTFQARFRREAQSAASLNHPAIVAVYDTGEDYVEGVSIPYIVMEYVDGSTLRELLHSGRKLLPERTLEMCIGILQALEYSHRSGIVHRDIKPANVMLTRNGQVKVMDFGIARAMGDSGMTMTQTSAVIGTAQYLSPEQAKGETVDARSDLYSTGCLLYELLTVRPPFVGDSPVAVAYQHVREEPQPPSIYDPEIPPDTDAIVLKALTKDPDYRYQSADEMRADIEASLDGRPIAASVAMGSVGYGGYDDRPTQALTPQRGGATTTMLPPSGDHYDTYDDYDRPSRRQKKNNTGLVLMVVAGVLVLVGAIFIGRAIFGDTGGQSSTVAVPNLVGISAEEATTRAERMELEVEVGEEEPCPNQAEGLVCRTTPAAGEDVERGSTVTLTVSSGPESVDLPDVTGQSYDSAQEELRELGLEVEQETQETTSEEAGTVLSQSPGSGEEVEAGATVTLTVATAPDTISMPDVAGKNLEEAKAQLEGGDFQFTVTTQRQRDDSRDPDTVISQTPRAGEAVQPGSSTSVHLIIAEPSDDPDEMDVPGDIIGRPFVEVRDQLQDMGLQVSVQGPDGDDAVVIGANPGPGSKIAEGGEITLVTNNNGDGGDDGGDDDGGPPGFIGGLGG